MKSSGEAKLLVENPFRLQVLRWYRRCLRAAFTAPWEKDEDALYVLEESRRLFHQNKDIRDVERIERKLREVEMRYELAMHYNVPYPRPFHKMQGTMQESGAPYCPYLDSSYDHAISPHMGPPCEGSTNSAIMGSALDASYYYADNVGTDTVEGRKSHLDTGRNEEPTSPLQRGGPTAHRL